MGSSDVVFTLNELYSMPKALTDDIANAAALNFSQVD
jgi:hypothetical protein